MKKIKKLLAVLSAITVIAVSSVCSASAETVEVYDVPNNITTISEFREYLKDNNITEKVWVTRDDYLMLFEQLTIDELRELVAYFNMESENISDRLVEYLRANGIDENEINSFVKNFYIGELQLYEKNEVRPVSPVVNNNFDYCSPSKPIELLTESSGTFESGVTYFYNEETKGLIFDGNGVLSYEDFSAAFRSFEFEFIFFGKEVVLGCYGGTDICFALGWTLNEETVYGFEKRPIIPIFTYAGTDFTKKFETMVEEYNADEDDYIYYTVDNDTDPYTFINPLEPVPQKITSNGSFGNDIKDLTSPRWYFESSTEAGMLIIVSLSNTSYTLNDVLEIAKDYNVTEICLGTDMSVLPDELQNCKTIEEAEETLLRIIESQRVVTEVMNYGTPAIANADVNQDGKIDALDTAVLVEMALGNYESVV